VIVLYQAEWCPYSSAVREVLTELGLDAVMRQVPAWPEERSELLARTGTDVIPVLETDDGQFYRGTRAIFAYLAEREPGRFAADHRERYAEHRPARQAEVPGQLIEMFRAEY
jgi:glutathione S-transferase